ncbi:MAG: hypothetical protein KTR26_13045 [Flammeovirgaceae bacterium]|nr:hypothetical protein [Flammeovirgaceae bacterium]
MEDDYQKISFPQSVPPSWLLSSSLIYLFFPFIIFSIGWLKIWFSLPLLLVSLFFCWRFYKKTSIQQKKSDSYSTKFLIILAFIALSWCLLSGIGGIFFQRFDYLKHNAIFRELVLNNWPVYFPESSYINDSAWLNYYISWYLPPALFSKIFGVESIEIFSLLWSWFGVWLILIWIVDLVQGRWWIGITTFMLFGGLELLVVLYQSIEYVASSGIDKAYFYHILRTGWEVAFANKVFRYMANTVLLTWSPQFAIGTWIATAMVWYFIRTKKYVPFTIPIGSVLLLWSPMATIGLALVCIFLFQKWHWINLFKPIEFLSSFPIIFVMFAFYTAHIPLDEPTFTFIEIPLIIFFWKYPLFLFIEYLSIAIIIWNNWVNEDKKHLNLVCILLALLALIKLGYNNDWLIQTGIAPLFIFILFVARFLATDHVNKLRKWKKYTLIFLLLCAFANPTRYFLISLFRSVLEPDLVTSVKIKDSPGLNDAGFSPNIGKQYLGHNMTFFYQVLARKL